jgi:hypothetical protein
MTISPSIRQLVRHRCEYCHADERWQFVRFTIDHVLPRSSGGDDQPDNLALACRNCNERRSNRNVGWDTESGGMVLLFNPRHDSWSQHFAWSPDGIRIVGQTPTGRATVVVLDLNDDRHDGIVLAVRLRDLQYGHHPPADDLILPLRED